MDEQNIDQQEQTPSKRSRKNPRRQLEDSIQQFDTLLASKTLKESKIADLLVEKTSLQKMLLQLTLDEKRDEQTQEISRLTTQHTADAARVTELEAQNAELKRQSSRVETVTVPDPEHAAVRRQMEDYRAAVEFLTTTAGGREQTCIRAVQTLDRQSATIVCNALGIPWNDYACWVRSYNTEIGLRNVIEKATAVDDSPLLRFCRASLAVNFDTTLAEPRSRLTPSKEKVETLTAEEKIVQAKRATGTLKNHPEPAIIGDFRPRVTT